jgi:predicted GNAT family N-acyltransferase
MYEGIDLLVIDEVWVNSDDRRKGTGRQLVQAAMKTAKLLTDDVYVYASPRVVTSILREECDSLTHTKKEVLSA